MDELLGQKKWNVGRMQLTYQENIPFADILACKSFKNAYEGTYIEEVKNPLANIKLNLSEFLALVDAKVPMIEEIYSKQYPNMDKNKLLEFFENEGFTEID